MSTPTGAGYGFVGSTFGETDLVSPYLQMYDIPKKEAQTFDTSEPFNPTATGEHQNSVISFFAQEFANNEINTNPEYISYRKGKNLSLEDSRKAQILIQEEDRMKSNITRAQEILNNSYNTYIDFGAKVGEHMGKYNNHHNRSKLQKYSNLSSMLAALSLGGEAKADHSHRSGARIAVRTDYLTQAAAESGVSIPELQSLVDSGAISISESGVATINPTASEFRLNQNDFIQSEDWISLVRKQPLPVKNISEGKLTELGYYDTKRDVMLIADQYSELLKPLVFSPSDFGLISIKEDGSIEINGDSSVMLEPPAIELAKKMQIDVDETGRVSAEGAKSIFNEMFKNGAAAQGFTQHQSKKPLKENQGKSPWDIEYAPTMVTVSGVSGFLQERITEIPGSSQYAVFDANTGLYKNENPSNAGEIVASITLGDSARMEVELNDTDGRLNINEISVSENGGIIVRGRVPKEQVTNILFVPNENKTEITPSSPKNIFEEKRGGYTHYLLANDSIINAIAAKYSLKVKYPNIDSNNARVRAWIKELDNRAPKVQFYEED